jgi:hypothetical protein
MIRERKNTHLKKKYTKKLKKMVEKKMENSYEYYQKRKAQFDAKNGFGNRLYF